MKTQEYNIKLEVIADFNHDGLPDEQNVPIKPPDGFVIITPIPNLSLLPRHKSGALELLGGINPLQVGKFTVRVSGSVSPDSRLSLSTEENVRNSLQLFLYQDGRWEAVNPQSLWDFPLGNNTNAEFIFGLISRVFKGADSNSRNDWVSKFSISARIRAYTGELLAEESINFRIAPFMLTSALDPVAEVLILNNTRTVHVVEALKFIIPQTGARLRILEFADGTESDVWVQDTVEIGVISCPGSQGVQQAVAVLTGLRAEHYEMNCEPLDRNVRHYFARLGSILVDAATPRAGTRWIDWYGNLEVSPPVQERNGREFPFGRILTGVQNKLTLHPDVLAFLEAQELQAPPLLVNTSWLKIGHVDEVVNFVPTSDAPGFRVLIPSTQMAKSILENLVRSGFRSVKVFANRQQETTVDRLLEEIAASAKNREIQEILDDTRKLLCEGLGIEQPDFIKVPVLFDEEGVAIIPNCVNSLICNGHVILPDPEGPAVNGEDAFASSIQTALGKLGLKLHFVDIWEPYHLHLGEVHCGTNAIRYASRSAWWHTAQRM